MATSYQRNRERLDALTGGFIAECREHGDSDETIARKLREILKSNPELMRDLRHELALPLTVSQAISKSLANPNAGPVTVGAQGDGHASDAHDLTESTRKARADYIAAEAAEPVEKSTSAVSKAIETALRNPGTQVRLGDGTDWADQ